MRMASVTLVGLRVSFHGSAGSGATPMAGEKMEELVAGCNVERAFTPIPYSSGF